MNYCYAEWHFNHVCMYVSLVFLRNTLNKTGHINIQRRERKLFKAVLNFIVLMLSVSELRDKLSILNILLNMNSELWVYVSQFFLTGASRWAGGNLSQNAVRNDRRRARRDPPTEQNNPRNHRGHRRGPREPMFSHPTPQIWLWLSIKA